MEKKEKLISIFRGSGIYNDYKLVVDKKYYYSDKNRTIYNGAFGELVTKYKTKDNNIKIYLRVDGSDTSFFYNVTNYDSLMMGRNDDGHFYIFNEREYIWAND
jgi:hypothetical protein